MNEIILESNDCWIDTKEVTEKARILKNKHLWNEPGIYILGIKNFEGRILPYYVGQTSQPLKKRIKSHVEDISNPNKTYAIFSEDFLRKKRGSKFDFIQRVGLPSDQYPNSEYGADLLYLNEDYFFYHPRVLNLFMKSGIPKRKHFPLNFLTPSPLFHQARLVQQNIFQAPDSFYFTTFSVLGSSQEEFKKSESFRTKIETFLKFSLKINTIGESDSYSRIWEFINLENNSIVISKFQCPMVENEFWDPKNRPTHKSIVLIP